jgi:hypothetical protein
MQGTNAAGNNIYVDPARGSPTFMATTCRRTIDRIKQPGTQIFGPKAVTDNLHVDRAIAKGETAKWGDRANYRRGRRAGSMGVATVRF